MPNISFDIFFNDDLINITASRAQGAPKVKPGWKARQAPKLSLKEKPTPESAFGPKAAAAVSNIVQNAPQYAQTLQSLANGLEQQQANPAPSAPKTSAPKPNPQAAKKPTTSAQSQGTSASKPPSTAKATQPATSQLNGAPKKPAAAATKKAA